MSGYNYINRATEIVQEFRQLVTANPTIAQGFVQSIPNGRLLVEFARRLLSASQRLDVPLIQYGAPVRADCSASAASNVGYADDQLQMTHHEDPFDIAPVGAYTTFPPSVELAGRTINRYVEELNRTRRYHEPDSQPRYLEVEGDVE
jgi:hypothetical protein